MDGFKAEHAVGTGASLMELVHGLTDALEGHYDWLWSVQRTLVCGAADPPPCRIAHWLEQADATALLGDEALATFREAHDAMHLAADRLLLEARCDGGAVPVGTYDDFLNSRKAFKQLALKLQRRLWSETCLVDSLTGLRNRHGMLQELREEQQRALRDGGICVLAMMDLDHFKGINDKHGHQAGDTVLRKVSRLVAKRLRPYDRVYRYGGEEFLICLPDTDLGRAEGVIDRLREEIASRPVPIGEHALPVTVSFGLAPVDPQHPVEESIRRADHALYAAKQAGRNRVVAAVHPGRLPMEQG